MTELLQKIGRRVASEATEAYFVGGCVRDLLRREPLKDIDIALLGDTFAIGKGLAREFSGHVFWLHQEEGVVRVVLPRHDGLQIDLCPLRGTLENDLRARDLTINAMAIAAAEGLQPDAHLLDPMGGQSDLARRQIRFCTPAAPEEDPLRTLRALRFRWKLGFSLDEAAARRISECVPLLSRVSVERVRDELFQLLAIVQADDALSECMQLGIGRWLVGRDIEIQAHKPPPSALRVTYLLKLLKQLPGELQQLVETEPTPPRRRREVLLWAAALQPLQPEVDPGGAARYLALSNEERQLISKGLEGARRITDLVDRWPVAGRERYRHFRAAGAAGPETVLLSSAATGKWSQGHELLLYEALERVLRPQPPLLTGTEVMRLLNLSPGPEVGTLMNAMEEARADGKLKTVEDAEDWLQTQAH